jgi:ankyrin repeat protein
MPAWSSAAAAAEDPCGTRVARASTLVRMTSDAVQPDSPQPASPSASEEQDEQVLALARAMLDDAREGRADSLLPLLDQGAPVAMRDARGNTLLMLAAYHGHADLVRELAARGADVDQLNDRQQSPLAGAVFKGYDDVVSALLGAGADPDAGTPSGRDSAAFFGREEMGRLIEETSPRG